MGQVHDESLSAFRLVKPMQMQWHHWLQVLQQTIASFLPLRLQCSCGQISFDTAFCFFFVGATECAQSDNKVSYIQRMSQRNSEESILILNELTETIIE